MPTSPVPESLSSTPAAKGSSVVYSDDGTDGGENNQDRQDHGYIYIYLTAENCLSLVKILFVCCSMSSLGA